MIDGAKEFLLIDENPNTVQYLYYFFKQCKLENKLLHAWNAEEALQILKHENTSDLKLVIVKFNNVSPAYEKLIEYIRKNDQLKLIPIVVLSNSWENKEVSKLEKMVINALILNPLDLVKFKRIIALAGYICNN